MRLSINRLQVHAQFFLVCLCVIGAAACTPAATPTPLPNVPSGIIPLPTLSETIAPTISSMDSRGIVPTPTMSEAIAPTVSGMSSGGIVPTPATPEPITPALGGMGAGGDAASGSAGELPVVNFSVSNSNHTSPSDVLREVFFAPTGGESDSDDDGKFCTPETSTFLIGTSEIMQDITIKSCGWEPNEAVTLTVTAPNGVSQILTQEPAYSADKNRYFVEFTFTTGISEPTGTYVFELTNSHHSVTESVKLSRPEGGRIKKADGGLLIYNFAPTEHVRLFAYRMHNHVCALEGWIELTTNPEGQALVKIDPTMKVYYSGASDEGARTSGDVFLAAENSISFRPVGDITGEVIDNDLLCDSVVIHTEEDQPGSVACGNAPQPRLLHASSARVTFSNGVNVSVRSGPGTSYKKIDSLPEGTKMYMRSAPTCADGYIWWKVAIGKKLEGWVAEGEPGNYFIEPWQ
jgi:hypothetical protein